MMEHDSGRNSSGPALETGMATLEQNCTGTLVEILIELLIAYEGSLTGQLDAKSVLTGATMVPLSNMRPVPAAVFSRFHAGYFGLLHTPVDNDAQVNAGITTTVGRNFVLTWLMGSWGVLWTIFRSQYLQHALAIKQKWLYFTRSVRIRLNSAAWSSIPTYWSSV